MAADARTLRADKIPEVRIDRSLSRSLAIYNDDPLRWSRETSELGPLVGLRFGSFTPSYILNDPDAARKMFITDAESWRRSYMTITPVRLAMGENLFTQSDRAWKVLQPALAPDFRKRALEPRLAEVEDLIAEEIAALPYDTDIDFDQALGRIALMVATWVLFGARLDHDRADELISHQRVVIDWLADRMGSTQAALPFGTGRAARHMREHQGAILAFAHELVDARRRDGRSQGDLLDALLAARPKGRPLSDAELADHVLGFFGAGNETTAAALTWAIVHGAAHPQQWVALRTDPTLATHYVTETLRLNPPAWGIPRSPASGVGQIEVGSHQVKVHRLQMVVANVYGMNRSESIWADAATFDPNRHRNPTKEQERSMIPFGLGPRGCIGQHIALVEMATVLPMLAAHGEVEVPGQPDGQPTFTLRVRGGLRGRFHRIEQRTESNAALAR